MRDGEFFMQDVLAWLSSWAPHAFIALILAVGVFTVWRLAYEKRQDARNHSEGDLP